VTMVGDHLLPDAPIRNRWAHAALWTNRDDRVRQAMTPSLHCGAVYDRTGTWREAGGYANTLWTR